MDVPHLVALKLLSWDGSAHGKPVNDIRELLRANRQVSLSAIQEVCERAGLTVEFGRLMRLLP